MTGSRVSAFAFGYGATGARLTKPSDYLKKIASGAVCGHSFGNAVERWQSGLSRTPGEREYPKRVSGVRIPPSPPARFFGKFAASGG